MILVSTVGATVAPIDYAINRLAPNYIVFICSADGRANGAKGSHRTVASNVKNNAYFPADHQSSSGIECEILMVPADDMDACLKEISLKLIELKRDRSEFDIRANFSGGSKSMSAALVLAAIQEANVRLEFVGGARDSQNRIVPGTESLRSIDNGVRVRVIAEDIRKEWRFYNYESAYRRFDELMIAELSTNNDLLQSLQCERDISRGYAAWDQFDHKEAARILAIYTPILGSKIGTWLKIARVLSENKFEQRDSLALLDLWNNALRQASRGRYDDAIGRAYRMIEATAQWLLKINFEIDTSKVEFSDLSADLGKEFIGKDEKDKVALSLMNSWRLLRDKSPDSPAGSYFGNNETVFRHNVNIRNNSLLAHGYRPVDEGQWEEFSSWITEGLLPVVRNEMANRKFATEIPQLPNDITEILA